MATATAQQKTTPTATETDSALRVATELARVAIAYTPELIEPAVQIPGGSFSVAFAPSFQRLELQPGLNFDVDPSLWASAKNLPSVQEMLAINAIQEISLEGEVGLPVSLLKREPETKANTLVLKCRDLDQLKAWLAVEERHSVQMTIQRRVKQLSEGVG